VHRQLTRRRAAPRSFKDAVKLKASASAGGQEEMEKMDAVVVRKVAVTGAGGRTVGR